MGDEVRHWKTLTRLDCIIEKKSVETLNVIGLPLPAAYLLQTRPSGVCQGSPQGQGLQHQPPETAVEQTRPQGSSHFAEPSMV